MDDLKIVGNENLTLEMFIMQIIHLKNVRQTEAQKIKINSDLDLNEHETNNSIFFFESGLVNEKKRGPCQTSSTTDSVFLIKKSPARQLRHGRVGKLEIECFQKSRDFDLAYRPN